MEKIGQLLKDKRIELGLSIEEISSQTRLTINNIKAIEDGDIDYFKNDMSYLRYFLRSYCEAVGIEFDDIKDELQGAVDDYTTTYSLNVIKEHEAMEQNIKERTKETRQKKVKQKRKLSVKKIDFSLISLIVVILVVVAGIVYVVMDSVIPNITNPSQEEPIGNGEEETPTPPKEDPIKLPDKEPEPEKKLTFVTDEKNPFIVYIDGLQEGEETVIKSSLTAYSWFEYRLNNIIQKDPASKNYNVDETFEIKGKFNKGDTIQISYGSFKLSSFTVNGEEITFDDSLKNESGVKKLYLKVR